MNYVTLCRLAASDEKHCSFKYRNKIGLDVAIEALRDCLHQRKATVDDLVHYACICRVDQVMKPYLEALLG